MEKRKSNSEDFIKTSDNFGKIYLLTKYKTKKKTMHLKVRKAAVFKSLFINVEELKIETPKRIKVAKTSCTSKNPIEIFPYNLSKSPLSERSFKTIIVLLKVIAMAP